MKTKKKNKKDREYMAILDQPIEVLKKPMGQPVDFDAELQMYCVPIQRKRSDYPLPNTTSPSSEYIAPPGILPPKIS